MSDGGKCYNPPMPWYIRLLRGVELGLYAIFFAGLLGGSNLLLSTKPSDAARRYTRSVEFDYVSWTLEALGVKLDQAVLDTPFYFTETARHQIVVDYLHLMDNILSNENQLNTVYTDPQVHDPETASIDLRTELDRLYSRQRQLAPMAEAVLQEQISATLADLGLTTGGQPLPPVLFHITHLPFNLIISPRKNPAGCCHLPSTRIDRGPADHSRKPGGFKPECFLPGGTGGRHRLVPYDGHAHDFPRLAL